LKIAHILTDRLSHCYECHDLRMNYYEIKFKSETPWITLCPRCTEELKCQLRTITE